MALLRYNLYTIKFTHFKYNKSTILMNLELYNHHRNPYMFLLYELSVDNKTIHFSQVQLYADN